MVGTRGRGHLPATAPTPATPTGRPPRPPTPPPAPTPARPASGPPAFVADRRPAPGRRGRRTDLRRPGRRARRPVGLRRFRALDSATDSSVNASSLDELPDRRRARRVVRRPARRRTRPVGRWTGWPPTWPDWPPRRPWPSSCCHGSDSDPRPSGSVAVDQLDLGGRHRPARRARSQYSHLGLVDVDATEAGRAPGLRRPSSPSPGWSTRPSPATVAAQFATLDAEVAAARTPDLDTGHVGHPRRPPGPLPPARRHRLDLARLAARARPLRHRGAAVVTPDRPGPSRRRQLLAGSGLATAAAVAAAGLGPGADAPPARRRPPRPRCRSTATTRPASPRPSRPGWSSPPST